MKKIFEKMFPATLLVFLLLLSVLLPVQANAAEPAAPYLESVKLVAADASRVEWQPVRGAEAYQVYCRVNGGPYTFVKTTTSTAIVHKKLKGGATYYYKVRAVSADNKKSGYSRSLPLLTISAARPDLTASVSGVQVTLKWKAVKNAAGYAVYRKTSSGEYKLVKSTQELIYKPSGLDLYTRYVFTVRPYRINDGRRFYGTAASVIAVTEKSGYFMDMFKPYETSTPMFMAYKNYANKTFYMCDDPYTHGMILETTGYAVYNLHSRYKKLSLTIGIVDGSVNPGRNRYIAFYGDDVLLKKLYIKGGSLPAAYTVNLTGITKFKIAEEGTGTLGGTTGLANIIISK